jgi:hypothetical protein
MDLPEQRLGPGDRLRRGRARSGHQMRQFFCRTEAPPPTDPRAGLVNEGAEMFALGTLRVCAIHIGPRVQVLPAFQIQGHLKRDEAATQADARPRCLVVRLL